MSYEYIGIFFNIIGSAVTAFSVFFAVWVYIRKRDSEDFAEFRSSLVELKNARDLYQKAVEESAFSEISYNVSDEIRKLFSPEESVEQVLSFLVDSENHDYVVTAIHLGLRRSDARKEAMSASEYLKSIPSKHEATLPLVSAIVKNCLFYVTWSLEMVTSSQPYIQNVLNPMMEKSEQQSLIKGRLSQAPSTKILFRYLAEIFYGSPYNMAKEGYTPLAGAASIIIDTLTGKMLTKNDRQLRKFQKNSGILFRTTPVPSDVVVDIDRAFFYLELMRDEFDQHEWDRILKAKLRIDEISLKMSE
jgi:hypothetical protein